MEKTSLKALKKYLRPAMGGLIFSVFAISVVPVWIITTMVMFHTFTVQLLLIGLIGTALFAVPLRFTVLDGFFRWHRYFRDAEEEKLNILIHDFEAGKALAEDRIRMGDTYMFGKQAAVPQRYDMTNRVYQHILSRYGQIVDRALIVRTHIGQECTLCSLHKKHGDQEAQEIFHAIKEKNQYVRIGYQE